MSDKPSDKPSNDPPDWLKHASRMMGQTPFLAGLNGEVVEVRAERARTRVPYGPQLVGDPDTGVVHGGVITGLLDHTCGMAVMGVLREPLPIATLDLRIDYMKPAVPGEEIVAEAHCLKVGRDVAFVRGSAYQNDAANPVAICTGTFMLMRGAPMAKE